MYRGSKGREDASGCDLTVLDRLFRAQDTLQKKVDVSSRHVQGKRLLTLPAYAPIPGNANLLTNPVGDSPQLTFVNSPFVCLLPLVLHVIALARNERSQDDPFCYGWTVDA